MRAHYLRVALAAVATCVVAAPVQAGNVMLQWFESKWETIEKKLPDAFMAGYTHFWFPPPSKADSGGQSVGYDVYDRFNLGTAFDQTLYGTESGLKQMIAVAHRANGRVYLDYVANHNGFRDTGTPGFDAAGGYPGFVLTLPGDVDGDFHSAYASAELEARLAGLIDIAQEKNNVFIRQPIVAGAQNIPRQSPNPLNARFYPDQQLASGVNGIKPFNLANPLAGDPVPENATGLLLRYAQWLVEVIGVDGLRVDAIKHIPTWFFSDYYDNVMYQRGRTNLDGSPSTPFSFGENFDGDFSVLNAYVRKDGYGNRDTLDFPLKFSMDSIFDGTGFADMRNLEFASYDGSDGNANDGTRGVLFVGSHDQFPCALDNVAYAHILTRTGFPAVYFNAQEFGTGRDFPKGGRGDALGGDFGSLIPRLVDISRRYAKGAHKTRWIDQDVYVYERSNSLLVGLSDRGDAGFDTRTVQTDFPAGTLLVELSGQVDDPVVNQFHDFSGTLTVDGSGQATIKVPRNKMGSNQHNKGFIMYGVPTPKQVQAITPLASVLAPETTSVVNGARRMTPLQVVKNTTFSVQVATVPGIDNDNALIRLDGGVPQGTGNGFITSGEFAGFQQFTGTHMPTSGSTSGTYEQIYDATALAEGIHFIETVAFLPRPGGSPAAYSSSRSVIYLDRVPPPIALTYPLTTGTSDVTSQNYTVVTNCPDYTADSMHFFADLPAGYDPVAHGDVNGSNKMSRTDRGEFRLNWSPAFVGQHYVTVVAFEPTGTYNYQRFGPIDVMIPKPNLSFGVDTDSATNSENFQPIPGTITDIAYANEFVIKVDVTSSPVDLSWPANFDVSVDIDGVNHPANSYSADLTQRENRLVQNDQVSGDHMDEFRFLWRGYGKGNHNLVARAKLKNSSLPENTIAAIINVPDSTTGPVCFIAAPSSGASLSAPSSIPVTVGHSQLAKSVQVFASVNGGAEQLFAAANGQNSISTVFPGPVGSYQEQDSFTGFPVTNGTWTLRAVAASGNDGTGMRGEATTSFTVSGLRPFPTTTAPAIDGDIREFLGNLAPLAVSTVDGGGTGGTGNDYGADGSLTEFHARVANDTLYLAVRGDMFNGGDPTKNCTIVYIDTNTTEGSGAKSFSTANSPTLTDTSDNGIRRKVARSGFYLSPALQAAGVGFDAAVCVDSSTSLVAKIYGFGSGGVPGTVSNFTELDGQVAMSSGLGSVAGAPGTTVNGPDGFEVAIPLNRLGNPNPASMGFVVVTCSDPNPGSTDPSSSPNTLPENTNNSFSGPHILDFVAKFPTQPAVKLNELGNGSPDFVEFYNPSGATANMTGWKLRWADAANLVYHVPLDGMQVPAGSYRMLFDGSVASPPTGSITSASNLAWDPSRAGSATLLDPYGLAVDYVRWNSLTAQTITDAVSAGTSFTGSAVSFTGGTYGSGGARSLSRDASSTDTNTPGDWAVRAPTPNAANTTSGIDVGTTTWEAY